MPSGISNVLYPMPTQLIDRSSIISSFSFCATNAFKPTTPVPLSIQYSLHEIREVALTSFVVLEISFPALPPASRHADRCTFDRHATLIRLLVDFLHSFPMIRIGDNLVSETQFGIGIRTPADPRRWGSLNGCSCEATLGWLRQRHET
jgi:hypothetical protein